MVFHCVYITLFRFPVCCWWTFGSFPVLATVNGAALNHFCHVFQCTSVCIFVGYISKRELLGHRVGVASGDNSSQLSKGIILIFTSTSNVWESLLFCSFTNSRYGLSFKCYPLWWMCSGILLWFYFAFSWLSPFSYVYCHLNVLYKNEVPVQDLATLGLGVCAFLLICKNSLYFLGTDCFFGCMCCKYLLLSGLPFSLS